MKIIDKIALILIIIGAINWGLIGLFKFNLVELLFGDMTILARIVYSLVGKPSSFIFLSVSLWVGSVVAGTW